MSTTPMIMIPLDLSDPRTARDWRLFLDSLKSGAARTAEEHKVGRRTVQRARQRVIAALNRVRV